MQSITMELYARSFGGLGFKEKAPYVATTGRFKPACDISMPCDSTYFRKLLLTLRYSKGWPDADAEQARKELGLLVRKALPSSILEFGGSNESEPIQVDLVLNAEELWQLPFEACLFGDGRPVFVDRCPPLILTRRIRWDDLPQHQPKWPIQPRVLFVHPSPGRDLSQQLINDHRQVLMDALYPWPELHAQLGADIEKALVVQKSPTIGDLESIFDRAREEKQPFTHVHILAHGQLIRDPQDPARYCWGLDLRGARPVEPEELANAISASDGLPAAVMVAVCDSANQTSPFDPGKSFAQELHRSGVPVVVASQLPLTQVGSVTLSRAFYPPLLRGGDVRSAVDAARSGLYRDPETGYDWMSLVAYVQLPEGYADLTLQAALQSELGLLEVAGHWAERLQRADSPSPQDIDRLAVRLSECIEALRRRKEQMDGAGAPSPAWEENQGLLGSAHKRLAQLLFDRYRRTADEAVLLESHRRLNEAIGHYHTAHKTNLMNHWAGVQRLSLEAALFSRIDPDDWIVVRRAAETDARNSNKIWALGSLAELSLLAPLAGRERQLEAAKDALVHMRANPAALVGNPSPIDSTRRQLRRYMAWWTKANGFFASCSGDLAADAEELVMSLE